MLSAKNKSLEENLHAMYGNMENHNSLFQLPKLMENSGDLLLLLINSAKNNVSKAKSSRRYDDVIKKFLSYVKLMGGSLLYETLHANLPHCIPSPTTVCKKILYRTTPIRALKSMLTR